MPMDFLTATSADYTALHAEKMLIRTFANEKHHPLNMFFIFTCLPEENNKDN